MKLVIILVMSLLISGSVNNDPEKMSWQENRKLTWADFQGTPGGNDDFVASTNSGISFSYAIKRQGESVELNYTVLSNFYPKDSWYRPEVASAYILAHEQNHFDISELHARKLRKLLTEIPVNENVKLLVDNLYGEIEQQRRSMQSSFDSDSDHSKNKEAEYRWRAFVAEQLQAYAAWK